jgi:hypothetical protein
VACCTRSAAVTAAELGMEAAKTRCCQHRLVGFGAGLSAPPGLVDCQPRSWLGHPVIRVRRGDQMFPGHRAMPLWVNKVVSWLRRQGQTGWAVSRGRVSVMILVHRSRLSWTPSRQR